MNPHDRDDVHRDWDELAVGWALHALEPEDEARFTDHLTSCARCARTAAETTEVMAAMAADLPPAEPSEGLRERLRAAVEQTEQLPPAPPRREPAAAPARPPAAPPAEGGFDLRRPSPVRTPDDRPAWRRVLPTALVAAGVAAVLSLGAWNVVLSGDRDAAEAAAAEQSRVLDALLQPGRAAVAPVLDDGRTVATVVAREGGVQVVSEGLPVNDDDTETYVVWGVPDGGDPEALGTFDVVTPQMDLRTVGSAETGVDDYAVYAISIEPGRQAPSSPTDIIGQGEVTS
ncbi:anti-sigma factor domain-containing protein [Modestobacter versicolor]|uniref:anti-sigma factor domain-containing protein n=1 Tax=Modestobacter versicolor TaxID=429133 RepID=UPI0034DE5216